MGDAELLRLLHTKRTAQAAPGLQSLVPSSTQTLVDVSRAALEARARAVLGDKVADAFVASAAAARAKAVDAEAHEKDNVYAVHHAEESMKRATAAPARVTLKTAAARDGGGVAEAQGGAAQSYLSRFGSAPSATGASNARAASSAPVKLAVSDIATILLDRVAEERELARLRKANEDGAAKPGTPGTPRDRK